MDHGIIISDSKRRHGVMSRGMTSVQSVRIVDGGRAVRQ